MRFRPVACRRSRATMRAINQALRTYRPQSRRGSSPSRNAHSRPDFRIQRGRADSPGGKVEGCSDLNADRHSEFLKVLIDPPLAFGLSERDHEDVGPGRADPPNQGSLLLPGESCNEGHSVPTTWSPG